MTTLRRFFGRDQDEGQAVVLFAVVMLAMFMIVGLAIDAGQLYSNKRTQQEAADAGAFAGAVVLYQSGTGAQAVAAAIADTTKNGYTTDDCTFATGNTCVVVNWPPSAGPYAGLNTHVEVIVTRKVSTSLLPATAFNMVRARGVAGAENLNSGYGIMALDRGATCSAFNTLAQGDLHLTGGGILVNSSCSTAATNSQGTPARFTITAPYGLDVNGNASGSWAADGIPVTPGHNQMPDPFANFPTPSTSGLPTCASLAACQDVLGNQNPGIYTVNLGGAGGTNMTLNPGIYILQAGMDTSGNANVNGTGVLLYNTYTTYPSNPGATPSCGTIKLAGNATSTLSAMTTGTWKNLLVYQDARCTTPVSIVGNGTFNGTGSFYAPSAAFSFSGNNATLTGSQLIANTVNIQNGNITINYTAGTTAQPTLPRLSE